VRRDEVHAGQTGEDHRVQRVPPTAANADHLDLRAQLSLELFHGPSGSEQLLHPTQESLTQRGRVAYERTSFLPLFRRIVQKTDRGGVLRALHHVGEPADVSRQPAADGKTED